MNRFVEGLGIELQPSYVAPASQRLADSGYFPLLDMMKIQSVNVTGADSGESFGL